MADAAGRDGGSAGARTGPAGGAAATAPGGRPAAPPPAIPQPIPGEIRPEAPPEAPRPGRIPLIRLLLPLVMLVAVVGMVAVLVLSGAGRNPVTLLFPVLMVVSTLGMLAGGARGGGADLDAARRDYQRHLVSIRRAVAAAVAAQHAHARAIHPDPGDLWALAGTARLWERAPGSPAFGQARVGLGVQRPATPVVAPKIAAPDTLDPVGAVALRRIIRASRTVPGLPVAVHLPDFPVLAVAGEPGAARGLVRAVVAQLATFHAPADLAIAAVGAPPEWDWLKWLPHHDPHRAARLLAGDGPDRGGPGLTALIVDGPLGQDAAAAAAGAPGLVVLQAAAGEGPLWDAAVAGGLALTVAGGRLVAATAGGDEDFAAADSLGPAAAAALARALCGRGTRPAGAAGATGRDPVLAALGLDPPPARITAEPRSGADRLRVPVGVDPAGEPVHLDLKEAAEGGVGPHGLCIGATGSGKSELLRTAVLALAATHPPEQLNLVLVDFKGGATFLGLEALPHVSAVITNLAEELVLVDRMREAITGEMTRRQELLRAAGNFQGVADYEAARRAGRSDLEPLPALLIVVDEFSELLGHRPEFAELFVAVGRLGRSLHMHLLLASQRLEEGRLRGLDSHLSYRIGLKTFSAAESRTVLGVPDAHHLPARPGSGYLKTDADPPRRFRAAYVSGAPAAPAAAADPADPALPRGPLVRAFTADADAAADPGADPVAPAAPAPGTPAPPGRASVLSATVAAVHYPGRRAHQVWLPPLPAAIPLAAVPPGEGPAEPLTAGIGVIDNPLRQRQDPLRVDLRGAGGHVAVVGAPRSGKTTALRTLALALAETTPAAGLRILVVDYGAGGLADLDRLPHVASVAHRGDAERLGRTIAEVAGELTARERLHRDRGFHSAGQARAAGVGDVLLLVDGYPALAEEHPELADTIGRIIAGGLAVGVHVALGAHRWTQLRPAVRDLLGTRVELRQAEALDSIHDRRAAAAVPQAPGRGLAEGGLAMLLAETAPADTDRVAARCRDRGDADVAALKLLPARLPLAELPAAVPGGAVPVGLDEEGLAPVSFDPAVDRHLIILGAAGSGRTTALRTIVDGLLRARPGLRLLVVDYRRGLLGAVPADRLAGYAGSAALAGPMAAELAGALRCRLPGPDITPERLAARDWWTGPEVAVVADDLDLVTGFGANPLAPLAEFIPHAADIGLHLVLARRIGGAIRALHEPVLGGVRDQAATALVLDGTREDGPVLGVTPDARPPGRGRWVRHGRPARVVQIAVPGTGAEPGAAP